LNVIGMLLLKLQTLELIDAKPLEGPEKLMAKK
jgi:hypothetical protein